MSKKILVKGKLLNLDSPIVMGILNITPDSFYDGGKFSNTKDIISRVETFLDEGADIIDIGAVSTRPGANIPNEETEYKRFKDALIPIRRHFPDAVISIDTFRSGIAEKLVNEFSVDIINDIFAGTYDNKMFDVIKRLQVPYIIMHMQGTPETMQNIPKYNNIVRELLLFFSEKVQKLREMGVRDVIIDPGFGFGKTLEHNYELLNRLDEFSITGLPIMVGLSRKSMINKALDIKASEALNGTTSLNTIALMKGANILRVHDVKEAVEVIKLMGFLEL